MSKLVSTLQHLASRLRSSIDALDTRVPPAESSWDPVDFRRYRLRGWPLLKDDYRTAGTWRMLSTMTVRAVSREWMLRESRLSQTTLDGLLAHLAAQHLLEEVDPPPP